MLMVVLIRSDRATAAGGILFLIFVLFTAAVQANVFNTVDHQATAWLQESLPRAIAIPFSVFDLLGSAEVLTVLLLGLLATSRRRQDLVILALYGGLLLVELAGKLLVVHPGPPVFAHAGLHLHLLSSAVQTPSSYPSGHAARTSFVSVVLYSFLCHREMRTSRWNAGTLCLLILINLVMAVSRIYLGDHWTSDVAGGLLLGLSLGILGVAFDRPAPDHPHKPATP